MSRVDLTISGRGADEPSSLRLILTLGLAGMLSGLVLAGVHQITRPMIEANQAEARRRAVFDVIPGATSMRQYVVRDGRLATALEAGDAVEAEPVVFGAFDADGLFLGYAIEGAGPGFQDTIRILYGFDPDRNIVTGMYVLESRETPGLGDKIFKDEAFVATFRALAVEPEIVLVKGGRTADNEVDAITGATISSRAVVKILNAADETWRPIIEATPAPPPETPSGGEAAATDVPAGEGD